MTNSSLIVLVFLFAVTFGGYLFAYITSFTRRQMQQQQPQMPPMYWAVPPQPPREDHRKERLVIWPLTVFIFIGAVLYLLYQYDGKAPDILGSKTQKYVPQLDLISRSSNEEGHIFPDEYAAGAQVSDVAIKAQKASQSIGRIVARHSEDILKPLDYTRGWGIRLVAKEQALRWIEDFEYEMEGYQRNGRILMTGSTLSRDGVKLQSFYLGPFQDQASAERMLNTLRRILPDVYLEQLEEVEELRPYGAAAKA